MSDEEPPVDAGVVEALCVRLADFTNARLEAHGLGAPIVRPDASAIIEEARAIAALSRPPSPAQGELEEWPLIKANILEQRGEENGFWRPCSGCYETVDGHDCGYYPHSQTFDSKLGGGCSECGGIGAVWDSIDYEEMAREMLADMKEEDGWKARASAAEAKLRDREGEIGELRGALRQTVLVAKKAGIPEGFLWGDDARQTFRDSRSMVAEAVEDHVNAALRASEKGEEGAADA